MISYIRSIYLRVKENLPGENIRSTGAAVGFNVTFGKHFAIQEKEIKR